MPVFEVELSDGRIVELESDAEPSEQDVLSAIGSGSAEPERATPAEIAPWMFDRGGSSLEPVSGFGLPASLEARPIEYKPPQDTIGPRERGGVFDVLSEAWGGPTGETYEQREALAAQGIHVPLTPKSFFTRPPPHVIPRMPTVEEAPPGGLERAMAYIPGMGSPALSAAFGPEVTVQAGRELYNLAAGLPEFAVSRPGVATLPFGTVAPRAVAGGFAADMLRSLLEQDANLQQNWGNMSAAERTRALVGMGFTGTLAGTLARTALKAPPFRGERGTSYVPRPGETHQTLQPSTLGKTYARSYPTPATLYGNVRPFTQPAQVLPAPQGGARVQPQAQQVAEKASEKVSIDELTELQTARDIGMLSELDAARLERIETDLGVRGLSTEDARYIIQEREGLQGTEIGGRQVGIEVVESAENQPFAPANKNAAFTINPETGNIVVISSEMRTYRSDMRKMGFSEAQINQAIKSSLNEELLHLGTDPMIATEYWSRLSSMEKLINRRRYGLGAEPENMTPELLGMEALRFRMQQAARMTPTEFTQMVRAERWTWQAITALERAVRFAREKFTNLGKEQRQLFDITLANLTSAKSAIVGASPAAPMRKIVEVEREDGTRYEAEFNGYYDMRPFGGKLVPSIGRGDVRSGQTLSHGLLAPTEKVVSEIPSFEEWQKAVGEGPVSPSAPRTRGRIAERFAEALSEMRTRGLRGKSFTANERGHVVTYSNVNGWYVHRQPTAKGEEVKLDRNQFFVPGTHQDASLIAEHFPDYNTFENANIRRMTSEMLPRLGGKELPESAWRGMLPDVTEEVSGFIDKISGPQLTHDQRIKVRQLSNDLQQWTIRLNEAKGQLQLNPGPGVRKMIQDNIDFREKKVAAIQKQIDAIQSKAKPIGPGAPRRKGPMSRRGEEMAKLQAMRVAAEEGRALPATEAGALRQSAYEQVTPELAAAEAERFVLEAKDPSFTGFTEAFQSRFGAIQSGQLRELFSENIGEALVRAPGKRIGEILKEMGLVKQVIGGGKPGERKLGAIPDDLGLPPREPEMRQAMMNLTGDESPLEISTALARAIRRKGVPKSKPMTGQQRLRYKAIGAILHRLFKQTEGLGKSIERKEVNPEELASPMTAKEPVYYDIRASELTDVDRLGTRLTSDARSFNKPVSASKRLVALLNKESKSVDLVDIYLDPRRGAVVMSPTGAGAHQSLESVMRTHRPLYSILLDEPVQNFRQRFKSLKEYNDRFGTDARARAEESLYEEFVGEPVGEPELEPGTVESSGTMARPEFRGGRGVLESGAPLQDAEARAVIEFVEESLPKIESVDDIALILDDLKIIRELEVKDRPLAAASGIIKMVRSAMRQNEDLTEGEALHDVTRFIYETRRRTRIESEPEVSRQRFVDLSMANYGRRTPEAGEIPESLVAEYAGKVRGREAIAQQRAVKRAEYFSSRKALDEWLKSRSGLSPSESGARTAMRVPKIQFEGTPERPLPVSREVVAPEGSPAEGIGAGLASTMARGTEVRRAAAEAGVPERAEAIRQEAQGETYESAFDRVIKTTGKAAREAEAESAKEVPRLEKETTEQWLERVREHAARMEEYKAAQDQAILGKEITPSAARRTGIPITKKLAELVVKPVSAGIRVGSEWMVDRLKRVVPEGATFTRRELDKASQIISDQQRYSGDMFNRFGDDMLREAGRNNKATRWMNEFQVVVPGKGAIANAFEAIEGRLIPPEFARELVGQAQEGNYLVGNFMESTSPDFIANGGMSRNLTTFGYDIIRDGRGPHFERLVEASAIANNIPRADVRKVFRKMKRVFDNPNSDPAAFFTVNQDFIRVMPRAITHLRTGGPGMLGHWEPVIHSELFSYFNHGIRRAAMIRAFRERYPAEQVRARPITSRQVTQALASPVREAATEVMSAEQRARQVRSPDFRKVINKMRSELPSQWHPLVNSLYRTLQGHPSENLTQTGWISEAGLERTPSITQPAGVAMRVLSPLGQTLKTGWLSQQVFLQPGELMSGASPIFFGYRKSALATIRHRELYPMLESIGAVDKIMYDNAWNPNSPIRGSLRIFNNVGRKYTGQNLFNELQESQAAGAAYINAQRLMEAWHNPDFKLTWTERNLLPRTFRVMGFTPDQVASMMRGDPKLLGQMVRKAASFASGGHMHPSEQSRLSANRAFQGMFWFQRYPMTRMNQLQKLVETTWDDAWAGDKKGARNGAILLAKFIGGAAQQGLLQTAILTMVYGGTFALALRFKEAKDEKGAFVFDMFRSAVGGPLQLATRGWEDSGLHGVANNFKRLAAPVNIAGDLYDVTNGTGPYSDMDLPTRIGKYLQKNAPLTKTVKFGVATFGLSQDDPKLDDSIRALNKWKRKKFGFETRESHWKLDESRKFRIQMKKAVEALKDGDAEAHLDAVMSAADVSREGVDPLRAVQDSFNARRVLTNPRTGGELTAEETDELINRIGEDAYDRLSALDLMLKHASGQGQD